MLRQCRLELVKVKRDDEADEIVIDFEFPVQGRSDENQNGLLVSLLPGLAEVNIAVSAQGIEPSLPGNKNIENSGRDVNTRNVLCDAVERHIVDVMCDDMLLFQGILWLEEGQEGSPNDNFVEALKTEVMSICGRRWEMEDAVRVVPSFVAGADGVYHFFEVFDGHGRT
ncbi:hypothetical protein SUGI_0377740 [Cryptomeria japonica]|nr:hypothetical protein SUGI_0377740 [Cryptomeria japonica]